MLIGICFLAIIFISLPLLKSIIGAMNKDAAKAVENTTRGVALASGALPTMGASFANSTIASSLNEVQQLKTALGCTDDTIRTMPQLSAWMENNGLL